MLTRSKNNQKKTFRDIIGLIRSRPEWERGPAAGLVSMLSPAEGAALLQNAALLLLSSQFQPLSLSVCLSVCLSQQGARSTNVRT